jgi:alpha-mannosidase
MLISSVRSTYCFVTLDDGRLAQVVRVAVQDCPSGAEARVALAGPDLAFAGSWQGRLDPALAGQDGGPAWAPAQDPGLLAPARFTPATGLPTGPVVEVPVIFSPGTTRGQKVWVRATVEAGGSVAQSEAEVTAEEPGWQMVMVAHFHYDPVWWNTQAGYTSGWDELLWAIERRETFQHTGLALVEAHLQRARLDPRYKFVLAEVDYLQPFWDLYPDRREEMRALLEAGRLEVVGGTYNEPNTNLTGAETAIRAVVYGLGFQRDVMGADPKSAWQLDVFGHDPAFPGIMAASGVTSSSWARGPFHQWGPRRHVGSNSWMQFPSEFEWVAPNGLGLLTSYMPNHYSAGWELEKATTLEGAMWQAYELFCDLAEVSATKVTLLPVGTDYTPPSRFAADLADAWNARYASPHFELGLPKEFFAAVRAELETTGRAASPQSRDMNPVYTGKDVSFIDTKQAQRKAETWMAEAELMAAVSSLLGGKVAWRSLDKAWRQLVFGAHHDGITGSESDQVYLDLLGGWREAYELARQAEAAGRAELVAAIDTTGQGEAVVVTNTLGRDRSELVRLEIPVLPAGQGVEVLDAAGSAVPALEEPGTHPGTRALTFLASDVPGIGYKTFRLSSGRVAKEGWSEATGRQISNEALEVEAGKQGGLARIVERGSGFSLVPEGEVAGELLVYPEHPNHPKFGEGPWHLLPAGPPARSGSAPADVHREVCAVGERLVIEGTMPAEGFTYRQVATLWQGSRRLELRTEVHGWQGRDRLLRMRVPTVLSGATAVSAVGGAVIGRGFGLIDVDSATAPWTLDNPAAEWFGLSTTLVVEAVEPAGGAGASSGASYHERSVGVAEVVTPAGQSAAPWARDLVIALLQRGVTATCSDAAANRYGALLGDSNLPDFRIAVGGPGDNAFVAEVLAGAGPTYREELEAQLSRQGFAMVLVPAERPLAQVWVPNADLRSARALPVLIVAGSPASVAQPAAGTAGAVGRLVEQVASGRVRVAQPAGLVPRPERVLGWTAALLNLGTPGFAVDISGAMYVSLLRSCTGWPSGVWIDPPRRCAPDGSAFELEHWSHVFDHALVVARGDWRDAGIALEAQAYNRPLVGSLVPSHAGRLPASSRLLGIAPTKSSGQPSGNDGAGDGRHPAGTVVLAALKPAGNPLASGDLPAGSMAPAEAAVQDDSDDGVEVTVRLYEVSGSPAEVELTSAFPILGARRADLVEQPGDEVPVSQTSGGAGGPGQTVTLAVGPGEMSTVRLRMAVETGRMAVESGRMAVESGGAAGVPGVPGAQEVELAQPVFSRYWLHNRGAAPMGNQGLAVHVMPTSLVARAGESVEVTAQVASGAARSVQAGRLEVVAPDGWSVEPPSQLFSLAPGAFSRVPVRVLVPANIRPGRRFVAVRIVDASQQVQEDVVTVDVLPKLEEAGSVDGQAAVGPIAGALAFGHPSGQLPAELKASLEEAALKVGPGERASLRLRLRNCTPGELRGEAQLISPVETWPLIPTWDQGFVLGPGEERLLEVAVEGPGEGWVESWALWKVTYFGRLWYSPATSLRLGTPGGQRAGEGHGELAGAQHG